MNYKKALQKRREAEQARVEAAAREVKRQIYNIREASRVPTHEEINRRENARWRDHSPFTAKLLMAGGHK